MKPTMQELMGWLRGYRYYDKDTRDMIASRVEAVLRMNEGTMEDHFEVAAVKEYARRVDRILNGEKT